MDRYQWLKDRLDYYLSHSRGAEHYAYRVIKEELECAPVHHGHWIEDYTHIVCSECGAEYSDEIIFMNRDFKYKSLNYCPNCGYQMDGDKNA